MRARSAVRVAAARGARSVYAKGEHESCEAPDMAPDIDVRAIRRAAGMT